MRLLVLGGSHFVGRALVEAALSVGHDVATPLPANIRSEPGPSPPFNRSGDRQLNYALYMVALSRTLNHQPRRDYRDRRRAEGKTDREIRRCIKRYIARRVWRLLEDSPTHEIAT